MKILNLLEGAMVNNSILVNDSYALSMGVARLHTDAEVFVWCSKDGRAVKQNNPSGLQRVILSPKLISDKGWYLDNTVKLYR